MRGNRAAPGLLYLGMSKLQKFDEASFDQDVLQAGGPVVIDFYADWCGPCKMMGPVIDQVAAEYEGKIKFGKVDVDAAPGVAMRYGIQGIPTLGVFEGGKLVGRLVGYPGPGGVREFVAKHTQAVAS